MPPLLTATKTITVPLATANVADAYGRVFSQALLEDLATRYRGAQMPLFEKPSSYTEAHGLTTGFSMRGTSLFCTIVLFSDPAGRAIGTLLDCDYPGAFAMGEDGEDGIARGPVLAFWTDCIHLHWTFLDRRLKLRLTLRQKMKDLYAARKPQKDNQRAPR